ncbi:hypothetical protein I4I73_12230 [Pseudonocardia sp. KRD-184]|uniref:Uncharacterized protein n=1 Tax=Pseudonocardia oceani TaxID=2792013 RepID=A0ABS6UCI9_9PSEU|nr:hypothetical protein [Pseudonocardia oceani]MBW0091166.1 hypothetical protein [Pseudonocardia oceani]MBW0096754.1 hypothetical protein [Pseudonocardia oceani]MBW0107888.1 hypothetical protein [Pseudonocardia oceani]MBW0121262.1 hypothetical protein [Pseudonocardia oceani]MBW0129954.1 hypothetical protein [Pseudonocardia oceani]
MITAAATAAPDAVDTGRRASRPSYHPLGNSGPQTVQEGTDAIVEPAQVAPDGPTGGFFDRSGAVPW